jgi:hypothetical protein
MLLTKSCISWDPLDSCVSPHFSRACGRASRSVERIIVYFACAQDRHRFIEQSQPSWRMIHAFRLPAIDQRNEVLVAARAALVV